MRKKEQRFLKVGLEYSENVILDKTFEQIAGRLSFATVNKYKSYRIVCIRSHFSHLNMYFTILSIQTSSPMKVGNTGDLIAL
jgi:hypothetical protein